MQIGRTVREANKDSSIVAHMGWDIRAQHSRFSSDSMITFGTGNPLSRTPIRSVLFTTKLDDMVRQRGRGRFGGIALGLVKLLALLNCEKFLVAEGRVEVMVTHARQ